MTYPSYIDDFELEALDLRKWHARQVPDKKRQISFSADAPSGEQSITVHVRDGDGGASCNNCQRAEIRAHGNLRPSHDEEFWHGFSFKVTGDIPSFGSVRTVLGQWKAPGDNSPFLAQRFDNGVFHVTVQDGPNRRTVASAQGDPDRLEEFQDLVAKLSNTAPELLHTSRALADVKLFRNAGHKFDGFEKGGFAQILVSSAETLANTSMSRTQALFDEFSYIHDIEKYAIRADVKTTRPGNKFLPDPKDDWVRMAYRIKAGRQDNNPEFGPARLGEIDIYANGEVVSSVRGNIGYRLESAPEDKSIYFKFGIYRDVLPGQLNFHFDNFAQGSTSSDVM